MQSDNSQQKPHVLLAHAVVISSPLLSHLLHGYHSALSVMS